MAERDAPPVDYDPIADAQILLGKAVARARAGEDRELSQKVRSGGEAVASLLAGLFKLSRAHAAHNQAFDAPIQELSRALTEIVYVLGTVHLVVVEDQVYVNDVRLRTETLTGMKDLAHDLARHNAGGVTFHAALEPPAVRALLAAFTEKPRDEAPRHALQTALLQAGVNTVELTPRVRFLEHHEDRDQKLDPFETLLRTMHLVDETYANVAYGRVMNPRPLRRVVSEVLQIGPGVPAFWESLDAGLPHTSHAAMVMLLSLLVGRAAHLGTGLLHDLGVAALVHDIGYTAVPADVARGPQGLARHPAEGARVMLRQRGFHVAKLRRLRAVLDHHRDHVEPRGAPSPLGAVLRIAEDYSTLIRVYRSRISPADALGAMARAAGRLYHPALMQVTVNALGRFPPGTLLELDDGRVVRCIAPARSPESFARPLVRAIDPVTKASTGETIDLATTGAIRRILRG